MLAIRPTAYEEHAFAHLLAEAVGSDGAFMARLREGWLDGSKRFDRPGEVLLGAWVGSRLIAVGGVTLDPYHPSPDLGRIRHFYVFGSERRQGVGPALIAALVERSSRHFRRLRLRTHNPAAALMYERAGFVRSDAPGETHRLSL